MLGDVPSVDRPRGGEAARLASAATRSPSCSGAWTFESRAIAAVEAGRAYGLDVVVRPGYEGEALTAAPQRRSMTQ